jgi:phosphatidylserine decarboxylase
MPASEPITFFNRYSHAMETEAIYGEGPLRFAYEHPVGRFFLELLVKRRAFSQVYGWLMDLPSSRERIAPFIARYGLDAGEMADPVSSFVSFNAFFSRKLKPSARPIALGDGTIVFPADGRHLAFPNVAEAPGFFVKGQQFSLPKFLGDAALAERFREGTLIISRLCPVDYHRFHFPCGGRVGESRLLNGALYSVSPIALRRRLAYFWENKRVLTRLESPTLGTVLIVEVGATNVGSIAQTARSGSDVAKGDEKGYFQFGGSTTITLFEPNRIDLAADLLEHSARHCELYARMGDLMALPRTTG